MKKKLQGIEESLPHEFLEDEDNLGRLGSKRVYSASREYDVAEEAASYYPSPKNAKVSQGWRYLALAASVILLVGLFFLFKDDILKTPQEIAKINKEETQVAVISLPVKSIGDSGFGFVRDTSHTSLLVVISKPLVIDSATRGLFSMLYSDTLFLRSSDSVAQLKIFEFNIAEENGEKIDDKGQSIEFQKPELKGIYLQVATNFYKVENSNNYIPLSPMKDAELDLLKFYTKK